MAERFVTYELEGRVARLGLDRLAERNARNTLLQTQLEAAVARARRLVKPGQSGDEHNADQESPAPHRLCARRRATWH